MQVSRILWAHACPDGKVLGCRPTERRWARKLRFWGPGAWTWNKIVLHSLHWMYKRIWKRGCQNNIWKWSLMLKMITVTWMCAVYSRFHSGWRHPHVCVHLCFIVFPSFSCDLFGSNTSRNAQCRLDCKCKFYAWRSERCTTESGQMM